MIEYVLVLSAAIIGYLFGSIPTAVWIGRFYFKLDVREHGSKNAGATNTFRVLGKKPGNRLGLPGSGRTGPAIGR